MDITRQTHWALFSLLLIMIGGIAFRLILWQEPVNSDDIKYFELSNILAPQDNAQNTTQPAITHPSELRTSFIQPFLIVKSFTGYTTTGFYLSVYIYAVIFACSIALTGWAYAGPKASLICMALWSVCPLLIEINNRLLPDSIGTAYALISLAAAIFANKLTFSNWRFILLCAVAGLFAYFSVSARITFAVFLAPVGVALLTSPRRTLALVSASAGFTIALVSEWILYAYFAGINIVSQRISVLTQQINVVENHPLFNSYTWSDILTRYPEMLWEKSPFVLTLCALSIGLFLMSWRYLNKPQRILGIALILPVLAVCLGVVGLSPPVPLMREKVRYFATVLPFFYLLLSIGLLSLFQHRNELGLFTRKTVLLVVVSLVPLMLLNARQSLSSPKASINGNRLLWDATEKIKLDQAQSGRNKLITTDQRTVRVLKLLFDNGWNFQYYDTWAYEANNQKSLCDFNESYWIVNYHRLEANYYHGYGGYTQAFNETVLGKVMRLMENKTPLFTLNSSYNRVVVTYPDEEHQPFDKPIKTADWHLHTAHTEDKSVSQHKLSENDYLYSYAGKPWLPPAQNFERAIGADWLKICFFASATKPRQRLYCTLRVWDKDDAKFTTHRIQKIIVHDDVRAASIFLDARLLKNHPYRILLTAKGEGDIEIRHLRLQFSKSTMPGL